MRLHRVLARWRQAQALEDGFSLLEVVIAITIIFGALLLLLSTALVGMADAALARQRQTANGIANQILEQVRALPYETVGQGLEDTKLPQDPNVVPCPDGEYYFEKCPSVDPAAEKIVHSAGLADVTPLVPNKGNVGPPTYPNTFTWRSYVTKAQGVPQAGAYRVTAIVSWNLTARQGVSNSVRNQTLIYRPGGTTDPSTGSGTFFQGTSDLARGSVKVTPNSGVSGGTGVSGLPSWDSITQDLSALSSAVTAQALTRSDSNVTLNGARKSLGGVPTEVGGASSVANADDFPDTSLTTSSTPPGVSQGATPTDIAGGGNRIGAGDAASTGGGGTCPASQPNLAWMTGMEHGTRSTLGGIFSPGVTAGTSADTAVKRSGAYSLKVTTTGAAAYAPALIGGFSSAQVAHFAIRLDALPTADITELAALYSAQSGTYAFHLGYQASTNKFMARIRSSSTSYGPWIVANTGAGTVTAGSWYTIDMRLDASASPLTASWQVNGTPQGGASIAGTSSTSNYQLVLGNSFSTTAGFTANYDDITTSQVATEYPIYDMAIQRLAPNGMGAGNGNPGTVMQDDDSTAVDSTSWSRLDEVPITGGTDYIKQVANSTGNHAEVTFADPAESCIRAVRGYMSWDPMNSSQANNGKTSVFDGASESVVWNGSMSNNSTTTHYTRAAFITPGGRVDAITGQPPPWTQAAVSGLVARMGYSSDASPNPRWLAVMLEYGVPAGSGAGGGGGAVGNQSGLSAATVPSASPAACFSSQVSGACSYSQEGYASSPPSLQTIANLAGSGAGDCVLYKHTPDVGLSSAYGRRDTAANATGSVVEDVVHYYGAHQLGGLCDGAGSPPAGWPGYLVKYDPGGAWSCAKAGAGLLAPFPKFCSVGTISYWNGSGVSTMSPPSAGASIPVANLVNYTSNGWRYDVIATLASSPSSVSQVPSNAPLVGTADRTEAKAVLGAPVAGKITYKLTNTATGNTVMDLTMDVDLGSLTATAVYKP